jgi:hypothetical protein
MPREARKIRSEIRKKNINYPYGYSMRRPTNVPFINSVTHDIRVGCKDVFCGEHWKDRLLVI